MNSSSQKVELAYELLWALRAGCATKDQLLQLEQLVREDAETRTIYVRYLHLCADLYWHTKDRPAEDEVDGVRGLGESAFATAVLSRSPMLGGNEAVHSASPIILDVDRAVVADSRRFAPGSMFFSYAIAVVILIGGLATGWIWQLGPQQAGSRDAASRLAATVEREPEVRFVGRVTGMLDCEWADAGAVPTEGSSINLGRQLSLSSGLLELTYDSGAKILLQGPCRYQVDSKDGGFLARGRLTAIVENKSPTTELQPVSQQAAEPNPTRHGSRLFAIRTPTAVVTDLGTEFGVEVDENGSSRAHVFRGRAEVRGRTGIGDAAAMSLVENESAQVELAAGNRSQVSRMALAADGFARQMPKWKPIAVHNTGQGQTERTDDPYWSFVARSDQPDFKPVPARVAIVNPQFRLPNDPGHSQWISFSGILPDDVVFTARTTFDLNGLSPKDAVLWGRYLVDDHIRQIRLNGHPVDWPITKEEGQFFAFRVFKITKGFVDGINVLEIDVLNGDYTFATPGSKSYMGLRVELEGWALEKWDTKGMEMRKAR